jgi:glucose-6-phosphate 1-dehydrogenase
MSSRPAPSTASIVIFGASGDLARRKLVPALYSLFTKGKLPELFRIVGFARSDFDDSSFREQMHEAVRTYGDSFQEDSWKKFATQLYYFQGQYDDDESLRLLQRRLEELEGGGAGRIYHLSVPPDLYAPIVEVIGRVGMATREGGWRRVIVEKPFGHDLQSARALNQSLRAVFGEDQIYRIDHYLGKETVQNILVFRFANTIFEPIWNRNHVSHVEITAAEQVDIERRGEYYDGVGVLRDMFQNHLMQLLALVAMEPPVSFDADALRNEKVKVLTSVRRQKTDILARNSVRGQYHGYADTDGVAEDSTTATFAALRLYIDNWRWQGVPFYLRSGKAMARKATEIIVHFQKPPHILFDSGRRGEITSNYIALCIQPDEGIHLRFEAKVPDTVAEMESVDMEFHYSDNFDGADMPGAYERLLLDALNGDAALFTRADEIELAWALIDDIIAGWTGTAAPPLSYYAPGTWGPAAADELLIHGGKQWTTGCAHDD